MPLLLAALIAASSAAYACVEGRSASAHVSGVYPTAEVLPENLLRFYIYFSEPMVREGIWDSVLLLDEHGEVVPGAFIENKFDLWSPNDMRLTVLFDPGRVKMGLVAHNTLGRALESGKTYTLLIRDSAETRAECALSAPFEKQFTVSEADFEAPDLAQWAIHAPISGTQEPLRITLNGPADHLSLAYRIRVTDDAGEKIRGSLRLADDERDWIFTPRQSWGQGPYQIEVNTSLEDLAGNRLTGLFDRPLDTAGYSIPDDDVKTLTFLPRIN